MSIFIWNNEPSKIYVWDTSISSVRVGDTKVRPTKLPWLCFTAEEAGSTVRLRKAGSPTSVNIETSTDWSTWTDYRCWTTCFS